MVTLTATPGTNYYFAGWGGSCSGTTCSFPINAATSVSATFNPGVGLTVALAGAGTGTVTSTPAGINCSAATPSTCTASFAPNAQVTLTETPATGDTFAAWSGAGCTGTATCSCDLDYGDQRHCYLQRAYAALTVSLAGTGTTEPSPALRLGSIVLMALRPAAALVSLLTRKSRSPKLQVPTALLPVGPVAPVRRVVPSRSLLRRPLPRHSAHPIFTEA